MPGLKSKDGILNLAPMYRIPRHFKSTSLTFFFLFISIALFSQTLVFKGVLKDEKTLLPIRDVNVKVMGTALGTATDRKGGFSVNPVKLPAALIFSCVGYENAYFKINEIPTYPVEFLLSPKTYALNEVSVSSKNYSYLFRDNEYSVLDYEIMNGNILLLIYKTLLKQSEAVLLNRSGDTLAISTLPETPPSALVKDFLLNVHYFSKSSNAFQCYYNENNRSMDFLYKTSSDSLQKVFRSLIFKISDRIYFQEVKPGGFGTAFGYMQKGSGKKYIRNYVNEKKIAESADDQGFYAQWNGLITSQIPAGDENGDMSAAKFAQSPKMGQYMNKYDVWAYQFEFYNMAYPVIKTIDNIILFFNFGDDVIEILNKDGNLIKKVPITFHKETVLKSDTISRIRLSDANWRWGNAILVDELNGNIYTTYLKAGMLRLNQVDPETGKLSQGTVIPLPFPDKIEIYGGEAYFLTKSKDENLKLAKCKL